jgi:hypothetical protein
MKKLIALAAVLVIAASSYGQGEVAFSTRNSLATPPLNAPVKLPDGTGPGPSFSAQLFIAGSLTPVANSLTTFQAPGTGGAAALSQYVQPVVASIPGSAGGTTVSLIMRAWNTSAGSFDTAKASGTWGESTPFSVTLTSAPSTPADLPSSFTGFNLTIVPEPSTIALGVLGAAALLIRRRK